MSDDFEGETTWPEPETDKPSLRTLTAWTLDGIAESTDGCQIEPDGTCEHGHVSWLRYLGYV